MSYFRFPVKYFAIIALVFLASVSYLAADDDYYSYDDEEQNEGVPIKEFFGHIGYGTYNWFGCAGFRWWSFGASIGVGALGHSTEAYFKPGNTQWNAQSTERAWDPGTEKKIVTLIVNADFYYFLKLSKKVDAFASIGFYSQSDSVIHKYISDPLVYPSATDNMYHFKPPTKTEWGAAMSFGGEYKYENNLKIGIGYHTVNGFFFRLGYYFY